MAKIPFLAIVNGKRAANGKAFSVQIDGKAEHDEPEDDDHDVSVLDCLEDLVEHLREQLETADVRMEIVTSI
jgi:hypothetical protein